MTNAVLEPIEIVDDGAGQFELTQALDSARAERTQRLYATGELVACVASVSQVDGKWKASFSLDSNEAGDSTYHAQEPLDRLKAQVFPDAQAAMAAAISALEDGMNALGDAREADDEEHSEEE